MNSSSGHFLIAERTPVQHLGRLPAPPLEQCRTTSSGRLNNLFTQKVSDAWATDALEMNACFAKRN
jgi:hypothetical protein